MLSRVMADLMRRPEERTRLGSEAKKIREVYRQDLVMEQWERCVMPHSP
jgi:hypothetical protein